MNNSSKVIIILLTITVLLIAIFSIASLNKNTKVGIQKRVEGFESLDESKYPGYIEKLNIVQKKHPNWKFTLFYTGLDWNDVIFNETSACHSINLVDSSEGAVGNGEWICPICSEKIYQEPGWKCTSKIGVSYVMDPRNFLDDKNIFQFESLSYVKGMYTIEGIEKILENSFMHNITVKELYKESIPNNNFSNKKFSQIIMQIAEKINVSPYHLAIRMVQSNIAMTGSSSELMDAVKGNVEGFEGLFNYFNIGSKQSGVYAREKGLYKAKEENWTTPEMSIEAGANYLTSNYIQIGQDTLYLEKFDIIDNEIDGMYWHQYMQNVHGAVLESEKSYNIYSNGMLDSAFSFVIPVFENMPKETIIPNKNEKIEITKVEDNLINATYYATKERAELLNDISGKVITTLDKGAKILVLSEKNKEYTKVLLYNGVEGYIKANVVDYSKEYNLDFHEVIEEQELFKEPKKFKLTILNSGDIVSVIMKNAYKDDEGNVWDKIETIEGIVAYCLDSKLK